MARWCTTCAKPILPHKASDSFAPSGLERSRRKVSDCGGDAVESRRESAQRYSHELWYREGVATGVPTRAHGHKALGFLFSTTDPPIRKSTCGIYITPDVHEEDRSVSAYPSAHNVGAH